MSFLILSTRERKSCCERMCVCCVVADAPGGWEYVDVVFDNSWPC